MPVRDVDRLDALPDVTILAQDKDYMARILDIATTSSSKSWQRLNPPVTFFNRFNTIWTYSLEIC